MNRLSPSLKTRLAQSGFFALSGSWFAPLVLVAAVFPTLAICGCERTPAAVAGPTHTVRGRVMKLPVAGDPSSSFSVFHEDIPQWLRPDGTRGMNAMIMPFPLAKGVSLESISLDDAVELSVQQYTTGPLPYEATAVRKLSSDTQLALPNRGT